MYLIDELLHWVEPEPDNDVILPAHLLWLGSRQTAHGHLLNCCGFLAANLSGEEGFQGRLAKHFPFGVIRVVVILSWKTLLLIVDWETLLRNTLVDSIDEYTIGNTELDMHRYSVHSSICIQYSICCTVKNGAHQHQGDENKAYALLMKESRSWEPDGGKEV